MKTRTALRLKLKKWRRDLTKFAGFKRSEAITAANKRRKSNRVKTLSRKKNWRLQ